MGMEARRDRTGMPAAVGNGSFRRDGEELAQSLCRAPPGDVCLEGSPGIAGALEYSCRLFLLEAHALHFSLLASGVYGREVEIRHRRGGGRKSTRLNSSHLGI